MGTVARIDPLGWSVFFGEGREGLDFYPTLGFGPRLLVPTVTYSRTHADTKRSAPLKRESAGFKGSVRVARMGGQPDRGSAVAEPGTGILALYDGEYVKGVKCHQVKVLLLGIPVGSQNGLSSQVAGEGGPFHAVDVALGFIDTEQISARCMLTIFQMFASKTEASKLNLLKGSPDTYLTQPIVRYIQARGGQIHTRRGVSRIEVNDSPPYPVTGLLLANGERVEADVYVCATAVEGAKRLIPEVWRQWPQFDNLYKLESVPVATVQLRFDGWVTELNPQGQAKRASQHPEALGIDNLLYTADADFSCFADLALTSPADYYKPGQGSLLQCVLTPGDPFISMPNEQIAQHVLHQVHELFPSSRQLNMTWYSVVKKALRPLKGAPRGKRKSRLAVCPPRLTKVWVCCLGSRVSSAPTCFIRANKLR